MCIRLGETLPKGLLPVDPDYHDPFEPLNFLILFHLKIQEDDEAIVSSLFRKIISIVIIMIIIFC